MVPDRHRAGRTFDTRTGVAEIDCGAAAVSFGGRGDRMAERVKRTTGGFSQCAEKSPEAFLSFCSDGDVASHSATGPAVGTGATWFNRVAAAYPRRDLSAICKKSFGMVGELASARGVAARRGGRLEEGARSDGDRGR